MKRKSRLPIFMAISLLILIFFNTTQVFSAETIAKPDAKYTFTSDWFTYNIPNWTRILQDMKGKPNLTYLEIGPYEGRSFLWVMDNILTHPSSKAIAIDTFAIFSDNDFEKTFLDNLKRSGHKSKVTVIKGSSQQKLRDIMLNTIDLIYVDGDHGSRGVLMDALFSWDLLKNGGILIFDDYGWDYTLPTEMRPTFALDVFLTLFQDELEVLIKDYQLIIRKTKKTCNEDMGFIKKGEIPLACTFLGQYVYYWKPQKLFDASNYREIILNQQEISIIEDTLINRKLSFNLELEKQKKNEYQKLLNKLKLNNIYLSPKEK